jgi:hypothetical protein
LVSGSPQELTALQAELATLYPELIFDLTAGSTLLVISEIQPIHFVPVVHQVEASSQTRGTVVGSLNDILVHQPNRMTPAHQITFKSGSCLAPWFSGTKQIEKDHPESCFKGALELPSGIRGKSRCAIDLPRCN